MGGWSHPDISLEDLIKLVKGFVDILILASGYQSSGQFAHWDPQNIKKASQWGLFFENVLKHLDDYQESAEKLDAELSELTSNPHFPQGLTELSSATLSRARKFILEHLIHTVPLSDSHLKAFVEATIEIDLDELQKTENNCLHVYLDKLNLQITMLNPCRGFMEDSPFPCPGNVPPRKAENIINSDFTMSTIQEIMRRELAVSCISTTETGMNSLTKIMCQCSPSELNNSFIPEQQKQATAPVAEEQLLESLTWRTRNLSYLLEKRTMRLVSGASMIFLAPKAQWTQVFERLNIPEKTDGDLHETIELLLLGLISSRWNPLLEHFMSVCNDFHDSLTIHSLYHEVHNLLLGRSQHVQSKEEMKRSKEQGILEFLEVLLGRQLHQLWKLSPILVAMSLPSWSQLFRLYLSELASQFKGESPTIRCCSCTEDSKEHIDCFGAFTSFMFAVRHNVWYQFCLRAALHFCWSHLAGEKLRMKTVNMLGSKKIQNMEVAKENLMQLLDSYFRECQNPGFYLMRQFVWRFKSQLKQALEWQRNTIQYSYDPKSYSQNFDDGFLE